jgi:hypothetical protein
MHRLSSPAPLVHMEVRDVLEQLRSSTVSIRMPARALEPRRYVFEPTAPAYKLCNSWQAKA